MSSFMIKRLVLKDWYFHRFTIAFYIAIGAVALALLGLGGEGAFFAGMVLLITVLISLGIHLTMATVVQERTEQTLPFVMSLPISAREYTTAKILANILIFLVPWVTLVLGSFAVIAGRPGVPKGLIPFFAVMLTEIFVSYCLILGVALVSESQTWTIAAMVAGNLAFNGFLYYVSHVPSMAASMKTNSLVWSPFVVRMLACELGAIAVLLGLTFYLQNRKTDFI